MTNPPPTKSPTGTPLQPTAAAQPVDMTGVGEPEGAARKGVRTAVGSDPQQGDGRYVSGLLHVVAPQGAIPTATSVCDCGRNRSAVGRKQVIALVEAHTAHRDLCPLRSSQEGRTAA